MHSFFDTYVALPWLKSNGYEINTIDSAYVSLLRWNRLTYNTRSYLQKQFKSETICEYKNDIGTIDWDKIILKKFLNLLVRVQIKKSIIQFHILVLHLIMEYIMVGVRKQ